MSLRNALQNAKNEPKSGFKCTVWLLLESLDAEDKKALIDALNDVEMQSTRITRVLKDNGFSIAEHSVARHRRKACSCP